MNILEKYDIQSDGVDCWTWTCMSKKPVHPKDVTILVKSVEFVLHCKCEIACSRSKQRMNYTCAHCQDFQISFSRTSKSANKGGPFFLDEMKKKFQNHSVDCWCYADQKKNECARLPSATVLKNHPLFLEFVKRQLYGKRETGNQQSHWMDAVNFFRSHQINMNSIKRKSFFNVFNEIKEKLVKANTRPRKRKISPNANDDRELLSNSEEVHSLSNTTSCASITNNHGDGEETQAANRNGPCQVEASVPETEPSENPTDDEENVFVPLTTTPITYCDL